MKYVSYSRTTFTRLINLGEFINNPEKYFRLPIHDHRQNFSSNQPNIRLTEFYWKINTGLLSESSDSGHFADKPTPSLRSNILEFDASCDGCCYSVKGLLTAGYWRKKVTSTYTFEDFLP